jgi:hypothetical protein
VERIIYTHQQQAVAESAYLQLQSQEDFMIFVWVEVWVWGQLRRDVKIIADNTKALTTYLVHSGHQTVQKIHQLLRKEIVPPPSIVVAVNTDQRKTLLLLFQC